MGCWDIFCCVCGNTCHTPLDGSFDETSITEEERDDVFDNVSKHLNKCSIILKNGSGVIHNCYNDNGNDFSTSEGDNYECIFDGFTQFGDDDNVGAFVHTDCYNFVKKEYGVELKFSHLPIIDGQMPNVNYGKIADYWQQDMDYFQMLEDNNMYMTINLMSTGSIYNKNTPVYFENKHKIEMTRLSLKSDKIDKVVEMVDVLLKKTKDKSKIMDIKSKIMDVKSKNNIKMKNELNEQTPKYLREKNRQRIRNIVDQFNLPSSPSSPSLAPISS